MFKSSLLFTFVFVFIAVKVLYWDPVLLFVVMSVLASKTEFLWVKL